MLIEKRIEELGLTLPAAPPPWQIMLPSAAAETSCFSLVPELFRMVSLLCSES